MIRPNDDAERGVRLWRPEGTPPPEPEETTMTERPAPDWTLAQLYKRRLREVEMQSLSPKTVKIVDRTVGYWVEATGDPPLEQLDERHTAKFVKYLQKQKGRMPRTKMARNTVRKHCTHLDRLLRLAGPRAACRDAVTKRGLFGLDPDDGLPRDAPAVKGRPPVQRREPNPFELAEVEIWLAHCDMASAPNLPGLPTGDWWRAIVLFAWNTGLRIETILELRWKWIESRGGRPTLVIPAGSYKGRRHGLALPLSTAALAAIEPLRKLGFQRIFPWPHTESHLHRVRRTMLRLAGLPEHRQLGFHALRAGVATNLAAVDPSLAQQVLGHTNVATTWGHYVGSKVVAEALEKLPQPKG